MHIQTYTHTHTLIKRYVTTSTQADKDTWDWHSVPLTSLLDCNKRFQHQISLNSIDFIFLETLPFHYIYLNETRTGALSTLAAQCPQVDKYVKNKSGYDDKK